jgi:hypothetical protein
MVWEMLYNAGYSLPTAEAEGAWRRAVAAAAAAAGEQPTPSGDDDDDHNAAADQPLLTRDEAERLPPDQLAAAIQARARAVAERAFWDSVEWRLRTGAQRGGGLAEQLAPMVAELARDVAGLLSGAAVTLAAEEAGSPSSSSSDQRQKALGEQSRALIERLGASEQRAAAAMASSASAAAADATSSSTTSLPAAVENLGGASTSALLAILGDLSRGLAAAAAATSGGRSAAAEAAAADADRRLRASVVAAAQAAATVAAANSSPADVEAAVAGCLAPAITCALRLLLAQAKLQRVDAANARLRALCGALRGGAGGGSSTTSNGDGSAAVSYLSSKLLEKWGVDSSSAAAQRLPRTAQWLREASAAVQEATSAVAASEPPSSGLGALCAPLAATGLLSEQPQQQQETDAASMVPTTLRAGLKRMPVAAGQQAEDSADALHPTFPALPPSWRASLRLALLARVAGDTPASDPSTLPEVLLLDRERLHDAQNALQRLLVLSGGMLVAGQLRAQAAAAGSGGTLSPTWTPAQADAGRRRLAVVLADPGMRLADLVTDLTALANDGWVAAETDGAPAAPPVQESRVRALFTSLVNPDSPGFRALRFNLCAAAAVGLLHGPSSPCANPKTSPALSALLQRAGAAALGEDVAALAARLASVVAVQEAVFGEVIEGLVVVS